VRLTLCLLTWDEIEGCRHDVPRLPLDQFEEVYAIDGGSTDGTCEYLTSAGIAVHRQDSPGYNGAYLSAFRRCSTDALLMFHPKGTIDPATVLQVRPLLERGADLVIASRLIAGGANEEDNRLLKPRKWFVVALGVIAGALWKQEGRRIRDVLHGYRAMRRGAFFAISPLATGVTMDLEMVVRSYKKRLRQVEFPVREAPRPRHGTHFPALATGRKLLRYLWFELKRAD
jgi:glycosyltransferase involved in cell wall biosynthesis